MGRRRRAAQSHQPLRAGLHPGRVHPRAGAVHPRRLRGDLRGGLQPPRSTRWCGSAADPETIPREPPQVYGSQQIELAWTIIPVLIVVVLFLATSRVIFSTQHPPRPPGAVVVTVIGHQFWWEYRYPGLNVVTANELHVPVSDPASPTPTFLQLYSADTDHSFWVPRLAGKTDLIPNFPNEMWIEPREPGLYLGQCAQYCGTQHAKMLLRVYVHSPRGLPALGAGAGAAGAGQPGGGARAAPLRADRVRELPHRRRDPGHGALRTRPDASHVPRHDRRGRGAQHPGEPPPLAGGPGGHQARSADAGHGALAPTSWTR